MHPDLLHNLSNSVAFAHSGDSVNLKHGSSMRVDLNPNGNARWYLSSDESVDLVVTLITAAANMGN